MEREGMFTSSTVSGLCSKLFAHLDTRSLPQLTARAHSLGIPIREGYSLERVVFVVAQAIANLLDEVSPEGDQRRRWRQGVQEYIQGYSTLNSAPNCLSGNLNMAALVFSTFCPRMSMWDILELVSTARDQLTQEEEILEDVRLQDRLMYLPNMRSSFTCHCLIFGESHTHPPMAQACSFCQKEFHAECQSSTLFCNCCFLRFCVFDLRESFLDPYGHGKAVEAAYFTYIENEYSRPHPEDNECVYFHIAKFTLPDMNNLDKKEKNFFVKMALVDRVFSGDLSPPAPRRGRGRPKDAKSFWLVDGTEYYLFLNHNEIRITNTISECAVIFKVIPRVLLPGNNILVVKCVKRNIKYDFPEHQENPYLRRKEENKPKIIMMGVYQTNKVRTGKQSKNKAASSSLTRQILPDISMAQSLLFIEHILKRVNKIEYQIVDLMDVTSREKIVNPVRSYSCTHVECFDFEEYRQKIKPSNYKPKGHSRKRRLPIDVDVEEEPEDNVIDLDSHSIIVIDELPNTPTPIAKKPILTPRERRREFLRRKRERQNFQKDPLFCPICNKRMLSLYTDPLFKSILVNSGFYTKVRIFSNGEFHFQSAPKLVPAPK